jgi:hypothetical protein
MESSIKACGQYTVKKNDTTAASAAVATQPEADMPTAPSMGAQWTHELDVRGMFRMWFATYTIYITIQKIPTGNYLHLLSQLVSRNYRGEPDGVKIPKGRMTRTKILKARISLGFRTDMRE